jgi:hypothetical protein
MAGMPRRQDFVLAPPRIAPELSDAVAATVRGTLHGHDRPVRN